MSKITKIAKIDNFGIFKNFDWDSSLKYQNKQGQDEIYDFKDINILYGRNYSGKTSLSKIIRSLERRVIPSKYDQPEFQIELSDGSIISQNNLTAFPYPIHVYNSDFLEENLKFIHDDSQNIESFSVTLGGDNQETLNRIQELKKELGSNEESSKTGINLCIGNKKIELESAQKTHQSKNSTLNDLLANEATKNESSIKNQHQKFGDINYNITKLNRDITVVQSAIYKALTDTQIKENEALITQRDLPEPPLLSAYSLKFNELINSTDSVLKTVVGGSQKIDELVSNGNLNNWVQTGFQLHHDRDTCAFCSNQFDEERRKILAQHFDEQTQKLQTRINDGIQHLENELYSSSLNMSFDISHYHEQYYSELHQLKSDLKISLDKQKVSIKQLQYLLKQKNAQLFTTLEKEYPQDYSNEIETILKKISEIRTACIEFNNGLTRKQKEAQEALRLNHVYHFLQTINFTNLKNEINLSLEAIEPIKEELIRLNARKIEIDNEIKHEEDKLKSEGEACIRINNILNHDFGHQHLNLKPIEVNTVNGKSFNFEIQRNQNGSQLKAHNLSEGEQSLIAFCYYLAKIQDDLEQDKKPILWIDDPICSLDSNHIFFIYSLIEEKIVRHPKYKQLFISTHNLEFLKYLKRLNGKQWGNTKFYSITRTFNSTSISQMPNYMKNYFSELNYLFQQLYLCACETNINDQNYNLFYNFPNNARKFLELYSNFHYPDGFSNNDREKLESFWGEHLAFTLTDRINNEYSHLSGIFERSFTPLEQPEMQKASLAILKKIIELNPKQYEGFLKSIGIESTTLDPLYIKLTT
ncbi:AAA family ATPase [Acinetobacter haemolyticus]|uniref:AAA family ATPase n=1 Tax=Acinetobacter haemolyticus TaxID=29430 RepID=UPI000ADF40E6|nr:AAA family ATPase [Acinetobacter haemolyticus]QHI27578.1 hypothetical protein Ahae2126ch_16305 [Acinetobacter haemolyticus]